MSMKQTPRDLDKHPQDSNDSLDQTSWPASTNAVYVSGGVWSTIPSTPPTVTPSPHLDARRYQLISLLGEGGMGQVWLGWDRQLDRHVAIKRPHDGHHPSIAAQLTYEATITARLEHPSIVSIYDVYVDGERPHFVMRLVRGQPLASYIDARTELATLVRHLLTACEALGHAHRRGISHRDISPMNILVGDQGSTHVIDWGFAALTSSLEGHTECIGTPGYTSPEQERGQSLGPPSDVWSLGAILHYIVTNAHPDGPLSALPSGPFANEPELHAITACALHQDPGSRYQDAAELAHELQRWFEGRRVRAYHITPWRLLRHALSQNKEKLALTVLVLVSISAVAAFGIINTHREARRARAAELLAIAQKEDAEKATRAAKKANASLVYEDAQQLADQQDVLNARVLARQSLELEPENPDARGLLAALATRSVPRRTHIGTLPVCPGKKWTLSTDPRDALCHGLIAGKQGAALSSWRMALDSKAPSKGTWLWRAGFERDPDNAFIGCGTQHAQHTGTVWRVISAYHPSCTTHDMKFDPESGQLLGSSPISGEPTISSDTLRMNLARTQLIDVPESKGVCPDKILNAARAPDGKVWVICTSYAVWKLSRQVVERVPVAERDQTHAIAFAPDTGLPWMTSSQGQLFTLEQSHLSWDFGESVKKMMFLGDSSLLLLLGLQGKLRVFDTQTRRWRFTMPETYQDITVDDDTTLRALRHDRSVIRWTFDKSSRIGRYHGTSGFAMAAWSRDHTLVAGVDGAGRAHLFAPFEGEIHAPRVVFDKTGKWVAASPFDQSFSLVGIGTPGVQHTSLQRGEVLIEQDKDYIREQTALKGVLFSKEGHVIYLDYGVEKVRLQRLGEQVHERDLMRGGSPHDGDTSNEHTYVGLLSTKHAARWDWERDGLELFYEHDNMVRAISVNERGEVLLATRNTLLVFDKQLEQIANLSIGGAAILDVEWVPEKPVAVLAHLDGEVSVWDLKTGRLIARGAEHRARVAKVDISRDGRWMLSAGWDGAIVIWDLAIAFDPEGLALE